MYKNELEIDVSRCLHALIKRVKFIAIIMLLFFIVGCGLTLNVGKDKYSARASVYAAAGSSYNDSANAVTIMNAYLSVASSYKVSERAALLMGRSDVTAADIQKSIGVNSSKTSTSSNSNINFMTSSATIIYFYANTEDPELSMEMADAVAQSYAQEMTEILNNDSVKMLDYAHTANKSYNAVLEAWKDRVKFALVGLVLACALVVACEIFDRKVRTVREATIRSQIPVIGLIPDYKE